MQTENLAYACLTRHSMEGNSHKEAMHWLANDLSEQTFSYQYFEAESNRIANVLKTLGVQTSDAVSIYLPRSPELVSCFFAVQKNLAVSCILFSTLGEEGLFDRLDNSSTRVVITKKSLLRKILAIKDTLPQLKYVLVTDEDEHPSECVLSLKELVAAASPEFEYPHRVDAELPAFLQYTSGSTGKPKGALHVHAALADMLQSFYEILAVQPDELYWCTADFAWITGLVYGIIAPMATTTRQIQFSGTYKASSWLKILESQKVNVWYTAPTALRMLMQEDVSMIGGYDTSALKRIYSVGEPLNPEIYTWGKRVFKREIYDTWFQSETGSIMIANHTGLAVRAGSMGKPRAGIEVCICDDNMQPVPVGTHGHLCLRSGWRSMFRTYFRRDEAYAEKFRGENYITGDLAWQDEDGYFWYVSRSDDVINSAGHLVGPFEIESALLEIEEVVDVAVIGVADPLLYQKIVAYLTLRGGLNWTRELELKCRIHVSNRVSTVAIPAEFHIIERVPKNQSGKILRRVLKTIYEGKDPGDLSTME